MNSHLTFQALTRRMIALYENEEYAEAYDLLEQEGRHFPEWARRIYFWRMCLASRKHEIDLALTLFEEAVEAGHWFFVTGLRDDPDLEPLQGLPRFEHLVEVCAQKQAEARAQASPSILVLEPENSASGVHRPLPLLIALHGNHSSAEESTDHWRSATARGCLVALPQSGQVDGPETYVWNDRDWTEQEIKDHYRALMEQYPIDERKVILGGFSMGARWAIWLSLNVSVKNRGFIAVAPFIPDAKQFTSLADASSPHNQRGYLVAGEQDVTCFAGTRDLADRLQAQRFPCKLETHADLAHAYPPDFAQSLDRALDFILQAE